MKNIKIIRRHKKMTLREVHEKTGISVTTLSDIENGIRTVTDDKLSKIAKALGVLVKELIE